MRGAAPPRRQPPDSGVQQWRVPAAAPGVAVAAQAGGSHHARQLSRLADMVKPERRTKGDLLAAAAIAVVVAAVACADLVDQRRPGHDQPARRDSGAQPESAPRKRPGQPASSCGPPPAPRRPAPVIVGGTVATGDGREVDGRDPGTGQTRWSYARDRDLCGVTWVYHYAVAVYPR